MEQAAAVHDSMWKIMFSQLDKDVDKAVCGDDVSVFSGVLLPVGLNYNSTFIICCRKQTHALLQYSTIFIILMTLAVS